MPRIIQPGGGSGKMRVRYTARRKRGLVAASNRMITEGMTLHAKAEELRVSASNLSKLASQGMGKIDCLDNILRSKKRARCTGSLPPRPQTPHTSRRPCRCRRQTWCTVVFEVVSRSCAGYFLFHVNKVHRCAYLYAHRSNDSILGIAGKLLIRRDNL